MLNVQVLNEVIFLFVKINYDLYVLQSYDAVNFSRISNRPIFPIVSYPMMKTHIADNKIVLFHKLEESVGLKPDGTT